MQRCCWGSIPSNFHVKLTRRIAATKTKVIFRLFFNNFDGAFELLIDAGLIKLWIIAIILSRGFF